MILLRYPIFLIKKEFELIDPEGNCILQQFWTQFLQPGWTVEQRLGPNISSKYFPSHLNYDPEIPLRELFEESPIQPPEKPLKPREGKLRKLGKIFKSKN